MPSSPKQAYVRNKSLRRLKPKQVRKYNSLFIEKYKHLIDGFTREEYVEYERILFGFSKRKAIYLLEYVQRNNYTGVIADMALLRTTDLIAHQRVLDRVRHRWTKLGEHRTNKLNQSPDQLWINIARSVQRNSKGREDKAIYKEWEGKEGLTILVQYLKDLYQKQGGKCAITGEPMVLTVDMNRRVAKEKCSVDRKYSTKGYVPGNIWLVSYWVNVMKSDMTIKEFWNKAKVISEAYQNRNLRNKA